jgi:TRAP-type C4-dicarboxylate transport system permease large subunit
MNLCIGLCSPPVGSLLFVGSAIGRTSIAAIVRPLMPMYLAMFLALMVVTYVPATAEWLPRVFGLVQ